jgi:serine/threonine-protein kinase RsbW
VADGDAERAGRVHVLHREAFATAEEVTKLRHVLTEWAAGTDLPAVTRQDLVLAAYEAMANVVEHAYRGGPAGTVEVRATYHPGDGLTLVVADRGRWRAPVETRFRGHGLPFLHAVAATEIERGREGTTVTVRWTP